MNFSVESDGKNLSTDDKFSFLNSVTSLLHNEEILIITGWEEMLNYLMGSSIRIVYCKVDLVTNSGFCLGSRKTTANTEGTGSTVSSAQGTQIQFLRGRNNIFV